MAREGARGPQESREGRGRAECCAAMGFRTWWQIPSLRGVLFVPHRRPQITLIERSSDGWLHREYRQGEVVTLQQPELRVAVDEVYSGIDLNTTR